MSRLLALPAAVALMQVSAAAQIEYGGSPPSTYQELTSTVPTVVMPPVDVEALEQEDAAAGKDTAFRFGENLDVDLGLDNAGVWEALPNGDRVWRLRIQSGGAFSLSFILSEYHLPSGAELYATNDAGLTLGMYNYQNNKPNGQMAIQPIEGSAVTLEYLEPTWVEFSGALRVGTVVHDYRDVISIFKGVDGPGDTHCETDVACSVGVPWQNQIDATTLLIIGGVLCSGSLLNNTAFNGTQLYITANHCGSLGNAIFRFKYQKSGCGTGGAPTGNTVQGSTQLATSAGIDYRLVRILPAIPASYNAYFAGWDRTGTFPPNSVTVHHPGGGPKKISFDNNSPVKSSTDWRILQWDLGVTEPGSSGCPLYDEDGRFIGQLWGGAAACGFPFDDFYGRLDSEWSQVSSHLDPLGSGVTFIDGFDPGGGGPGGPSISSITPGTIEALIPGTAQTVSINGSGFAPSTIVSVDGAVLAGFPSPYSFVSSSLITVDMPQVGKTGAIDVSVSNGLVSDTAQINVIAPPLPLLQAGTGNSPVTAFSFAGIDITMSSLPNDQFLLFWSPSNVPSVLPGIASLAIGNNFASLFAVGTFTIDATAAWNEIHASLTGVLPATTFFIEGVVLRATGFAFPLDDSNHQEVTVLF